MRVSVDDPGARYWEVWLDGEKLKYCTAADSCRGWAKCRAVGSDGELVFDGDGFHEVILFGRVTLRRIVPNGVAFSHEPIQQQAGTAEAIAGSGSRDRGSEHHHARGHRPGESCVAETRVAGVRRPAGRRDL